MTGHDPNSATRTIRLGQIAHARSGDKGTGANIGVIAESEADYQLIRDHLTAGTVAEFFHSMGVTPCRPLRAAQLAGAQLRPTWHPEPGDAGRRSRQGAGPGDP